MQTYIDKAIYYHQWRTVGQRIGGGGGTEWKSDKCEGAERSDRAWGEGLGGGCPPSQGREIFQFWGQNRVIWCMQ